MKTNILYKSVIFCAMSTALLYMSQSCQKHYDMVPPPVIQEDDDLDDDDRRRILSGERLEDMIITIMDMQNAYFRREGIKSAAVSDELYGFIRSGGTL